MNDPAQGVLTIDEAVAEFHRMMEAHGEPGSGAPPEPLPEMPEDAETRHFLTAHYLIGAACPEPRHCADQRCRRDRACRHLVRMKSRFAARRSSHPRRTPGADALRYAIWVYVSARRRGQGRDVFGRG